MAVLDLIGFSANFRALLDNIDIIAPVDSAVLTQGETSTSKEVIARAIHEASSAQEQLCDPAMRRTVEHEASAVAIDLKNVAIVDREVVKLLALSESNGPELKNCPLYIRQWVTRERAETKARARRSQAWMEKSY